MDTAFGRLVRFADPDGHVWYGEAPSVADPTTLVGEIVPVYAGNAPWEEEFCMTSEFKVVHEVRCFTLFKRTVATCSELTPSLADSLSSCCHTFLPLRRNELSPPHRRDTSESHLATHKSPSSLIYNRAGWKGQIPSTPALFNKIPGQYIIEQGDVRQY
jgi:hypothetical protein